MPVWWWWWWWWEVFTPVHPPVSMPDSRPWELLAEWLFACRWANVAVVITDMLRRYCMQGRPLSIPLHLSLSLLSSYLLSFIIDCSHCTNFICLLWIMNETRSGGAFSFPLVWYPISHFTVYLSDAGPGPGFPTRASMFGLRGAGEKGGKTVCNKGNKSCQ